MAEQPRPQQSDPPQCANNCGYYGYPATLNLCTVCFHRHCLLNGLPTNSLSPSAAKGAGSAAAAAVAAASAAAAPEAAKAAPSRCAACRKRVGLTGFPCRCGATFCGAHRYPEAHGCGFDFKAAGREAIARENPVMKGEKLVDRI